MHQWIDGLLLRNLKFGSRSIKSETIKDKKFWEEVIAFPLMENEKTKEGTHRQQGDLICLKSYGDTERHNRHTDSKMNS
jgi:hypothetical protein